MRAREVLDALDRVALFRTQARRGRIEEIGEDLDSALSLLKLQSQSSRQQQATCKTAGTITGGEILYRIFRRCVNTVCNALISKRVRS